MVPLDHIQRAHPLPSSYQVHLLLQDLDLRANPHFHHGKDQVISIQHQHLLNATHSQVWESDNLSMQISFMYRDPAEDVAIFPVSRAASYRWKGILSTSTVCFYSRNLLQQLLVCSLTACAYNWPGRNFLMSNSEHFWRTSRSSMLRNNHERYHNLPLFSWLGNSSMSRKYVSPMIFTW